MCVHVCVCVCVCVCVSQIDFILFTSSRFAHTLPLLPHPQFQSHIFTCLAAVLHMGNVKFSQDDNEYSHIVSTAPLQTVSVRNRPTHTHKSHILTHTHSQVTHPHTPHSQVTNPNTHTHKSHIHSQITHLHKSHILTHTYTPLCCPNCQHTPTHTNMYTCSAHSHSHTLTLSPHSHSHTLTHSHSHTHSHTHTYTHAHTGAVWH